MGENNNIDYPTFVGLTCPKCGNSEFKIVGTKESAKTTIKNAANIGILGGFGNMVNSMNSETDFEMKPTKFQCLKCKNKFDSLPNVANDDELLDKPCTITFKRLPSLIGGAVIQQVFLNGIKMGSVPNNSELSFNTYTKTNVVFVTDHNGNAFKGDFKFTAESGGKQEIKFKRKFV